MTYTTLGTVELKNAVFINDRKNSAVSIEAKHTEDGKKWLFVKRLQSNKDPVLNCTLNYAAIKQLEIIRDSVGVVPLMLKDGRAMSVMIKDLDPKAFFDFIEYDDDDLFDITLNLTEI